MDFRSNSFISLIVIIFIVLVLDGCSCSRGYEIFQIFSYPQYPYGEKASLDGDSKYFGQITYLMRNGHSSKNNLKRITIRVFDRQKNKEILTDSVDIKMGDPASLVEWKDFGRINVYICEATVINEGTYIIKKNLDNIEKYIANIQYKYDRREGKFYRTKETYTDIVAPTVQR